MNDFSRLIYKLRKEKGYTQSQLGDLLNVTDKAVSRWENGDSFPETNLLKPLAKIFDITVDELLEGKLNERPNLINEFENDNYARYNENKNNENYLQTNEVKPLSTKQALIISFSVGLILIGVLLTSVLAILNVQFSALPLFIAISISVYILITSQMYKTLNDNDYDLDKVKKGKLYAHLIAIGVVFFILSPVSVLFASIISPVIYISILFSCIIIGLPFVIVGGVGWAREIEYNSKRKKANPKQEKIANALRSIIMMLAVLSFILLGVLKGLWHPGWIVFIIAGVLCGIVSVIFSDAE